MVEEVHINSLDEYLYRVRIPRIAPAALSALHRVYRGQTSDDPLIPSLFRFDNLFRPWDQLESEVMATFKREAIAFTDRLPKREIEWLALAQHHRVPTRILDWSMSPLVALFFAVEYVNPAVDELEMLKPGLPKGVHETIQKPTDPPFVVWSVMPMSVFVRDVPDDHLSKMTKATLYQPKWLARRVSAQSSCFTVHPLPGPSKSPPDPFPPYEIDPETEFIKYVFSGCNRMDIRAQLDDLGINNDTIYPDLDGLGQKLKWRVQRALRASRYIAEPG